MMPRPLLIALAAALVPLGCARYRTFDLLAEPAHMRENCEERSGLNVAAQLLVDEPALEHYFGPELRSARYFTVIVDLENRGQSSFEFVRKEFAVVLENGDRFEPVPALEVLRDVRRPGVSFGAVLLAPLVFPVILEYRNAEEYNFDMARNFQRKSFPGALRLESGDPPITKALYFRDPGEALRPPSSFASSVLQFVAEVEGSPTRRDAGGVEGAVAEEGSAPGSVGRRITFTISLSRKEI